jgi:hypothetical protein
MCVPWMNGQSSEWSENGEDPRAYHSTRVPEVPLLEGDACDVSKEAGVRRTSSRDQVRVAVVPHRNSTEKHNGEPRRTHGPAGIRSSLRSGLVIVSHRSEGYSGCEGWAI